jgi:hypothetical protein
MSRRVDDVGQCHTFWRCFSAASRTKYSASAALTRKAHAALGMRGLRRPIRCSLLARRRAMHELHPLSGRVRCAMPESPPVNSPVPLACATVSVPAPKSVLAAHSQTRIESHPLHPMWNAPIPQGAPARNMRTSVAIDSFPYAQLSANGGLTIGAQRSRLA